MMRSKRLMERLAARGISAALIHKRVNMRYLSGYTGEGCLLVTDEGMTVFTDFRYIEQVSRQAPESRCVRTRNGQELHALVLEALGGRQSLAIEDDFLSHRDYCYFADHLPGVALHPMEREVERLREIKDEAEIAAIQRAAAVACAAFDKLLGLLRPGVSEKELATELDDLLLRGGAERTGFDTIACAGANGSLPHAIPSDYRLREGELITFDFGAVVDGYTSDMTRTVALGKVSDELRAIYDTVLTAQQMALEAIRPGVACNAIDKIARDYIDARYPGAFGHGLGHGVGLEVHENPRFNQSCADVLVPGHVITVEPGVYVPGLGGCRIEDMAILTENGFIDPNTAPKQLITL